MGKYSKEDLSQNFTLIINENKHSKFLTPREFNKISKISVKSYVHTLKCNWCDVLKTYNQFDRMYKYIKNLYMEYTKNTNYKNLHKFAKENNLGYDFLELIGLDKIKEDCNIEKLRYTDADFKNNFFKLWNDCGHIPLYSEFRSLSKISDVSYANRFHLKGKVYDDIVKMYTSILEYEEYIKNKKEHKTNVGKITGALSSQLTDEELKEEFIKVFEYCKDEYDIYPPRRYFDKISKHDSSVYRRRYNLNWTDVCKKYGYKITKESNKTEKIVLKNIADILNTTYIPQKTWLWLIGNGGKNMYCDGYFEEYNLIIEFDGVQHRKPIDKFGGIEKYVRLKENDALKDKLLEEHGYKLIRIDSRSKWYDEDYLKKVLADNGINYENKIV